MQNTATDCEMKPLTPGKAAEAMWNYYREHKALLIADVTANRPAILAELIKGVPIENVFVPYFRPPEPEPETPARRARQVRDVTMTAIHPNRS